MEQKVEMWSVAHKMLHSPLPGAGAGYETKDPLLTSPPGPCLLNSVSVIQRKKSKEQPPEGERP